MLETNYICYYGKKVELIEMKTIVIEILKSEYACFKHNL